MKSSEFAYYEEQIPINKFPLNLIILVFHSYPSKPVVKLVSI